MIEKETINDFFMIPGIDILQDHGLSLEFDLETRTYDDFSLEMDVEIYLVNHVTGFHNLLTSDRFELEAKVKAIEDLRSEKGDITPFIFH